MDHLVMSPRASNEDRRLFAPRCKGLLPQLRDDLASARSPRAGVRPRRRHTRRDERRTMRESVIVTTPSLSLPHQKDGRERCGTHLRKAPRRVIGRGRGRAKSPCAGGKALLIFAASGGSIRGQVAPVAPRSPRQEQYDHVTGAGFGAELARQGSNWLESWLIWCVMGAS